MENKFSLKDYALFASIFILKYEVNAEVIYTDISDIIIDNNYDLYNVDLDNNGTDDYDFIKFSGSYVWATSSGWTEIRFANILHFHRNPLENQVAGISFSTYFSYLHYWPYALPSGSLIGDDLQFQNGFVQQIASKIDPLPIGGGVMHEGYWWPITEDKYLGLHFIDTDSNYHYGWIRCSVLDSAEVLIIKDYAYETEIEHPIVAGDTLSYVGINNQTQLLDAIIYSFGKDIMVNVNNIVDAKISISDMQGKICITKTIKNKSEIINMDVYTTGVYLVTIRQNENSYTKKVFIE